jgi:DNA topoisomerase IB
MPIPQNIRELKRYKKEVGKTVATELGNSPTIALNSYVAPEVFCVWEEKSPLPKKKAAANFTSLKSEFLECVHYDLEVPMEESTDSGPAYRSDED